MDNKFDNNLDNNLENNDNSMNNANLSEINNINSEEFHRINEIDSDTINAKKEDTRRKIENLRAEAKNRNSGHYENIYFNNEHNCGSYSTNERLYNENVNYNSVNNTSPIRNKRRGSSFKRGVGYCAAALGLGVIASLGFQTTNYLTGTLVKPHTANISEVKENKELNIPVSTENVKVLSDVSEIVKDIKPSMVSISAVTTKQMQDFFNGNYVREIPVSGSGFIISEDNNNLYIATNNHVVENAKNLSVNFLGDKVAKAVVKGSDPYNDLAVVSVNKKDLPNGVYNEIKVAKLGDSNALIEGEPVVAIGNALGFGQSSTNGIVSALNRTVITEDGVKMSDLIQTNAAINPGNSGGALVNSKGEVIGINTIKTESRGVEGMGYAIPISKAQPILKNILNDKTHLVDEKDRGMLGIKGIAISDSVHENYGIPVGFFVKEVVDGSGAAKAGIKKSDVIVAINGFKVANQQDIINRLQYFKVGDKVKVSLMVPEGSDYTKKEIEVVVSSKDSNDKDNVREDSNSYYDTNRIPSNGIPDIFNLPWNE